MNKFESSNLGGEKKESKFETMIRKLRAEGYEFETADDGSVFMIKVPDREIGITKIPGVETDKGWMSFEEIVENSIKESAPRKESPSSESSGSQEKENEGL